MSESEEDILFMEIGDFGRCLQVATTSDNNDGSVSCSLTSFMTSESPDLVQIKSLQAVSEDKVLQYKTLLEQVNCAQIEYKMSEFLVSCAKESSTKMVPKVRGKLQTVWANSAAETHIKLKSSKDGESFNVLGLTNENLKGLKDTVLSHFEKLECDKHMNETVKRKVQELKKQNQKLIGTFNLNGQKKEPTDDLMLMKSHIEYKEIVADLQNQVPRGLHLLKDISETILKLSQLNQGSGLELLELSYNLLCQKATFISTFICILKHQVDSKMYGNQGYNSALNSYGDSIKILIEDISYQLNDLKASLSEYEGKEKTSQKYKTVVQDYYKAKKELQHKRQTLAMLFTDSPARGSNKT